VTTPPGATVLVDGHTVGVTPYELSGKPDEMIKIRLQLGGYKDSDEQVMLGGGVAEFSMKPLHNEHRPKHTVGKKDQASPSSPNAAPRFGDE
jgi:hypothetical protein